MASHAVTPDQRPVWKYFEQVVLAVHSSSFESGTLRLAQLTRWRCSRLDTVGRRVRVLVGFPASGEARQ